MPRKEFPQFVVESVLIKCRRHCCVCDTFCGQKIVTHHIESPDDNSEDNAIPVCFDCHAEINSYNISHPLGRRFTPGELKKLRDETFKKYSFNVLSFPTGLTDYGRAFHDGFEWAERISNIKDIWRFISQHGDFAIEILICFENEDTHSMMDETLFAEVDTGMSLPQREGHSFAWSSGRVLGLWDIDANSEVLFLTKKGKSFRELIFKTAELKRRFEQLKTFWDNHAQTESAKKPEVITKKQSYDFPPGVMNWLQIEINRLIRLENRKELYVILNVTPVKLELRSLETGEIVEYASNEINDVKLDQETNELILKLN